MDHGNDAVNRRIREAMAIPDPVFYLPTRTQKWERAGSPAPSVIEHYRDPLIPGRSVCGRWTYGDDLPECGLQVKICRHCASERDRRLKLSTGSR